MSAINIYNSIRSPAIATFEDHNEPFPFANLETKAVPLLVVFFKDLAIVENV